MPYQYNAYEGENLAAEANSKPPFGPGFTEKRIWGQVIYPPSRPGEIPRKSPRS